MKEILNAFPTPLTILLSPFSLIILGIYASLILWEALFPARKLPHLKYWKLKGMASFTLFFYLSVYFPLLWNSYLGDFQLFNLTFLGPFREAVTGIVVYELGLYFWHLSIHKNHTLWKIFHRRHHSAKRVDSYGAFYFSPMDMIGFTFLTSLCLAGIAGFTTEATTFIILGNTFLGIFQHSNIHTPVWIGYFIQRPESHTIHHAPGIHTYNYSDLPVFDILFGTFKNPAEYAPETKEANPGKTGTL